MTLFSNDTNLSNFHFSLLVGILWPLFPTIFFIIDHQRKYLYRYDLTDIIIYLAFYLYIYLVTTPLYYLKLVSDKKGIKWNFILFPCLIIAALLPAIVFSVFYTN